jgi:alkane 1-monooxygenase
VLVALHAAGSEAWGILDWWGMTLALGCTVGGVGMGAAHELLHRPARWQRMLGEMLAIQACYPHFAIEHRSVHHTRVATHRDPMTARLGEGFFDFYARATVDGFIQAWRHEARRCRRNGIAPLGPGNGLVTRVACMAGLLLAVLFAFGPASLALFVAQGAVAHLMVVAMNYIQHYGLRRSRTSDGTLERLAPWHSWDAGGVLSNWLFFDLGRHGQHHCLAERRFHTRVQQAEAVRLPAGYLPMFALALIPCAWRKAMDRQAVACRLAHGALDRVSESGGSSANLLNGEAIK